MRVGDTAEATFVVQPSDTAKALSTQNDFPDVFATSRLVALMELAAARALKPLLQPGQMSVGVALNIRHTAATPVGGNVRAVATYLGPDGKLFRFKVQAFDDAGPIGEGEHTRAIIDAKRLVSGAARRKHDASGGKSPHSKG
jgi:predicted thioesterase